MDDLNQVFSSAYKDGKLLETIHEKARENWKNLDVLVADLIRLHNSKDINLIASFSTLKNELNSGAEFFSTRHILEKLLPELDAPIAEVMECVINLVKEAGQDMAAGTLLPPFTDFCASNASRPREAISLIERLPEKYFDLLPQVIIAGARLDVELYLDIAIRLAKSDDIELRRRAAFSLGRTENLKENSLIEKAILCLEGTVQEETDDRLLGDVIDSVFNLWKQSKTYLERITVIIDKALLQGGDYTLHAGARLFGFNKELPTSILDSLLTHLLRIKPENTGSLEYIDFGLASLIEQGNPKYLEFLENLLLSNPEKLSMSVFDSAMREFFKNQNNTLNRLMTRWFIKGDRVLCDGISEITDLAHESNIQLAIESSDFDYSQSNLVIFLARKAIGYLFSKPVTAASIVVSLMHYATGETMQILINLLFDFLLINYPGKIGEYLRKKIETETDEVKKSLETTIKLFDDYFEGIKSTGNIPELYPSQSQRDTYNRRFSKIMEQAMKDAQKDSVLLSLVSTSVLLYGRKSIDYVYTADGQSNRMEIPLQAHSTEIEFPRTTNIDPFGLDYTLRVFRAERIKQ
jgi:hypothetical protein